MTGGVSEDPDRPRATEVQEAAWFVSSAMRAAKWAQLARLVDIPVWR